MGYKHGDRGRFRLNRLARPGTMALGGVINGKSRREAQSTGKEGTPTYEAVRSEAQGNEELTADMDGDEAVTRQDFLICRNAYRACRRLFAHSRGDI